MVGCRQVEGPGKGSYTQLQMLRVKSLITLRRPGAVLFSTEAAVTFWTAWEDLGVGASTDRDRALVKNKWPCPEDSGLEGTPGNPDENVD